jgi:hypothetical protein
MAVILTVIADSQSHLHILAPTQIQGVEMVRRYANAHGIMPGCTAVS